MDRLEPGDPERIGEFWLARRLGAGGQGVVYEAYDPGGGRVAIKVLHGASESPRELERMAAEARAAQRVASFCTARILQVHLEPPRPYIVSEYIDGLSLQDAVEGRRGRASRRFGGDDLHRLGIGIATALTAIHQAKVVHRDLKPGNVMLGPDGPRLIDFGIARVLDTGSATQDGGLVGTLRYMPPEVYAGQRAGAEADVFAWGAIMVFAATGRHAFTGRDLPQIAHQVRTRDPDLSALPGSLRPLVAEALAKDPLRRPSASQILATLTGDPRQGAGDPQNLVDRGAELAGPPTGWAPGDPALGKLAEDAYTALPPEEQNLVPEVFLRCLVPGEDGSWSVRPVPAAELFDRPDPAEGQALERVVQAFAPLLTLTDGKVVLARPAVLRAWPRLRDWAGNRHEDLSAHHRVRQAAHVWDANGRRRGDVLTGAHLDQALHWITTRHRPAPNRLERGLLDASTRAQTIRTRRTRTIALVLAVTTLLSLTATGWAFQAQQNANRQRDAVVSRQLITQSQQATDPVTSALLAAAAWRLQESPESRGTLVSILAKPHHPVLTSRTGPVQALTFGPDGRPLAASGDGKTVQLWDVRARRQIGAPLTGHTDTVSAVAFSPDGRILATAGLDNTVRLWDVRSQHQIGTFRTGHSSIINAVAFSPDGRTLATGGGDSTVQLWDVRSRRQIGASLTGHTDQVNSVAFSHDGRTLATGGGDTTVRLWDVVTHSQIGVSLTGHTDHVNSVAFSRDGRTLATGGVDSTVRLWSVRAHRQIGAPLTGHSNVVNSVAFSRDGRTLASGGDNTVRLWDAQTRRPIGAPLTGHTSTISAVAFGPDNRTLATGGDSTVRLWNVRAHRQIGAPLTGHAEGITSVTFSRDGRTLATGGDNTTVRLWDRRTRRQTGAFRTGPTGSVDAVSFSRDGRTLATLATGGDNKVRLWDARAHRQIGAPLTGGGITLFAFSPDGATLATTDDSKGVQLWDARARRQIGAPFTTHTGLVNSLAFSPDGRTLAIGGNGDGSDSTVRLWDAKTRRPIGVPLTGHTDTVSAVAFSPDGHTLASSSADGTVRLWDVRTRRPIGAPLTGHAEGITSVTFSRDGRTLATGGEDETARLWDVGARRQIGEPLKGHTGIVSSVAFSPDGRTLATGGDSTVRLWDVAMPADLVGSVCAMAGRTLTPQEWTQYVPDGPEFRKVCP